MNKSVLMVLTSQSQLGDTGNLTGSWVEELAAPYYVFQDSGLTVELATATGGEAPLDPASLDDPWLTAAGKRFMGDAEAQNALKSTTKLSEIDAAKFAAVFCVGGAGAAWDFPVDADLRNIVEHIHSSGGVVSAVCHGVLGLAGAQGADGKPLVSGRRVTAVSNVEEELTTFDKVVPILPESRLTELGAVYSKAAEPFGEHVVVDGKIVTGQNPASAALAAQSILKLLAS
jgi:putative intracellular protease/amidase